MKRFYKKNRGSLTLFYLIILLVIILAIRLFRYNFFSFLSRIPSTSQQVIIPTISVFPKEILRSAQNDRESQNDIKNYESAVVTKIIDGDTIEINENEKVRYIGIDAPEIHESECFADEAMKRNTQLVLGKEIHLVKDVSDTDDYKRKLRYIFLSDGTFVNKILIEEGMAEALPIKPDLHYATELFQQESLAKEQKKGLWAACTTVPTPREQTCVIKGNVNENNEKVYHLPNCTDYKKTYINRTGEYWFCTEQEAIEKGFRKAKNCND